MKELLDKYRNHQLYWLLRDMVNEIIDQKEQIESMKAQIDKLSQPQQSKPRGRPKKVDAK